MVRNSINFNKNIFLCSHSKSSFLLGNFIILNTFDSISQVLLKIGLQSVSPRYLHAESGNAFNTSDFCSNHGRFRDAQLY